MKKGIFTVVLQNLDKILQQILMGIVAMYIIIFNWNHPLYIQQMVITI